jgi:hypothetical protein
MRSTTKGAASAAPTLGQYVRHAERFGGELVFETAGGLVWPFKPDLSIRQLGALSMRLQRLDPTWRLPKAEDGKFEVRGVDRALFALDLVAAGEPRDRACAAAMISRSTLQRELRESARPAKWHPGAAFVSDGDVSNREGWGDCPDPADLRPDAVTRSGPDPAQLGLFEGVGR